MAGNQLFLPQDAVDLWLADGRIAIEGDRMQLNGPGLELQLTSALRFVQEVADGQDPHDLVGKVKSVEAVSAMEGEHYADSVVLGDNAYEVVEGFMGEVQPESVPSDSDVTALVTAWLAEVAP